MNNNNNYRNNNKKKKKKNSINNNNNFKAKTNLKINQYSKTIMEKSRRYHKNYRFRCKILLFLLILNCQIGIHYRKRRNQLNYQDLNFLQMNMKQIMNNFKILQKMKWKHLNKMKLQRKKLNNKNSFKNLYLCMIFMIKT